MSLKLRIVQGLTIEHISKITGYSYSAVRHLISSYNRYELKEILVKEYCGNHRNMTPEEEKKFLEPFKQQASAGEILEVSEIITA